MNIARNVVLAVIFAVAVTGCEQQEQSTKHYKMSDVIVTKDMIYCPIDEVWVIKSKVISLNHRLGSVNVGTARIAYSCATGTVAELADKLDLH